MNRGIMWPVRQDMTRDECRKCLRCLELDAYGSMVSVLRAQGPFTSEKQKLLQELAKILHISNERHRAEVRRAVNDERLATIAEQLNGPNTGIDWTIEGRRTIPLLPRLKARNAFTTLANSLSLATVMANEKKPVEQNDEQKGSVIESQVHVKLEEDLTVTENNISDRKRPLPEVNVLNKDLEIDSTKVNHIVSELFVPIEEHISSLPIAPPNKFLVVSPTLSETSDHSFVEKAQVENNVTASQQQNIATIPIAVDSIEVNNIESSDDAVCTVASKTNEDHTISHSNKYINTTVSVCTTNGTKKTSKLMSQNKITSKVIPVISAPNNTLCLAENSTTDRQQIQTNNTETHNSVEVVRPEGTNSDTCINRVTSIAQPKTKPTAAKTIISNNSHCVMAVCPGTTVSSGPGPPQAKQTTALTCKKLPATVLNHQPMAKMSVALNSNKTVNISHHPNTKLSTKTNVIVIQKGHAKGVTLSHAGKEVLGKVIMGGTSLHVASQQNASSVNVLQQHITLNNGDQAITTLSSIPYTESIQSNAKSGNTIVFDVRQDVLEKKQVLSQFIESSVIPSPESETVIEDINREDDDNSHLLNTESMESMEIDTVPTSTAEENQHRSI